MNKRAFSSIPISARKDKIRSNQITMMVDRGMGLRQTKDILELAGEYFDLAKIVVGTSALMAEDLLKEKIKMLNDYQVICFPGGQFFEYAIWNDKVDTYINEAKKVGFKCIEVSDNILDITLSSKLELIKYASNADLKVLGETGKKGQSTSIKDLILDINKSLEAGAWKVLIEAAEFFNQGEFNHDLIENIAKSVDLDKVIVELPGKWIKGVNDSVILDTFIWLLENVGYDVNIGNINPEKVLYFEAQRRNLGVKMKFK